MQYLNEVKQLVNRLGGEGRFQNDEYVAGDISPTFAGMLVAEARAFGRPDLVLGDAPSSECHVNSMKYVMGHGGELWSGFALSGGVWRVHSWVVKNSEVIEPTPHARERYVGIAITTEERVRACFPTTTARRSSRASRRRSS